MGDKFLTTDNPEYTALLNLIKRSDPISVSAKDLEWVLWEAQHRHDVEKSGVGIQTAPYDANKIFKRQALGLLGEFALFVDAQRRGIALDADFTRNTKKEDMKINGKPLGAKLCTWTDGAPMTPQIDIEEFKAHPIPQAILYVCFNEPRLLDSGWEPSKNALKINWITCIGILPPDVLLSGVDKAYGVGSNPRKGGFTKFSAVEALR